MRLHGRGVAFSVFLWLSLLTPAIAMTTSDVPCSSFRLPEPVEIIIVVLIAAASIWLGLMALPLAQLPPLGWLAQAALIVLLIPLFEEVIFRFFLIEVLGKGIFGGTNTQVFIFATVLFAIAHLVIALVAVAGVSVLSPPIPGIQACEGLLIGCFNGLLYIMLRFCLTPPVGLLVTMMYCWLFHIFFNLCMVIFNVVANVLLGAIGVFLHVVIRLALLVGGFVILMQCYLRGVETVISEMWMR